MWIFLDIDGVLVPDRKFNPSLSRQDLLKFDPECLNEFETVLRRHPLVKIVISSSWREIFAFKMIQPLFSPDIAPRVVGVTPFLDSEMIDEFQYLRHAEVLMYLRQNNLTTASWLAVDDIPEHYAPGTLMVVTDAGIGFDKQAGLLLDSYLSQLAINN